MWEAGDEEATDRVFAEAEIVVKRDAIYPRWHPAPLETCGMIADFNPLTTESDGEEARYAHLVADELGVPALDVKVVAADTDRFGENHGFNTSPSAGAPAAITSATAKILAKAKLLAGAELEVPADSLSWRDGAFSRRALRRT